MTQTPEEQAAILEDMVGDWQDGNTATARASRADETEALRAGAAALRRGWQPIDTAPKDGTRLLLARKQVMSGELTVVSGHWNSGGAYNLPHWSTLTNMNGSFGRPRQDWTHWMPLPDPPASPEVR